MSTPLDYGTFADLPSFTRPGRSNRLVARAIVALHWGIVGLVGMAWALPFAPLWWAIVVLAPLTQLQWWMSDGVCILTTLENHLRGNPMAGRVTQETFVGRILRPLIGELERSTVDRTCTVGLWLVFAICVARLGLS